MAVEPTSLATLEERIRERATQTTGTIHALVRPQHTHTNTRAEIQTAATNTGELEYLHATITEETSNRAESGMWIHKQTIQHGSPNHLQITFGPYTLLHDARGAGETTGLRLTRRPTRTQQRLLQQTLKTLTINADTLPATPGTYKLQTQRPFIDRQKHNDAVAGLYDSLYESNRRFTYESLGEQEGFRFKQEPTENGKRAYTQQLALNRTAGTEEFATIKEFLAKGHDDFKNHETYLLFGLATK